jgi:hypothetical protein
VAVGAPVRRDGQLSVDTDPHSTSRMRGAEVMREVVQLTNVASTKEADIPDRHFESQYLLVKSVR